MWETTNLALIAQIQNGTVTQADLTAAGAVQRGVASDDYGPGCPDTGNGCLDFYAVSIPGVTPSAFLNWFQAVAAARNAGKRLPSNAEWQAAALGTPDPGEPGVGSEACNTANGGGPGLNALVPTGSRENCLSDVGPPTWWGTSSSGWPTGCRNLIRLRPVPPVCSRRMISTAWPGPLLAQRVPARSSAAAITAPSASAAAWVPGSSR